MENIIGNGINPENSRKGSMNIALRLAFIALVVDVIYLLYTYSLQYLNLGAIYGVASLSGYFAFILPKFIGFILPLAAVFFTIILFRTWALHKRFQSLASGNTLTEEEKRVSLKQVKSLSFFMAVINILPFTLGGIYRLMTDKTIPPDLHTWMGAPFYILMNTAIGAMVGFFQISLFNRVLADPLRRFQVYYLDPDESNKGLVRNRVFYSLVILLAFSLMYLTVENQKADYQRKLYIGSLNSALSGSSTLEQAQREYQEKVGTIMGLAPEVIPFQDPETLKSLPLSLILFIFTGLPILALGVYFLLALLNDQRSQIREARKSLDFILGGAGDLTSRITIVHDDDVGELTDSINRMMEKFRQMFLQVQTTSVDVQASGQDVIHAVGKAEEATKTVADFVETLEMSTAEQASFASRAGQALEDMLQRIQAVNQNLQAQSNFVDDTSSAVEEMVANIESVNNLTKKAEGLAQQLISTSGEGGGAVQRSIQSIREIEVMSKKVQDNIKLISKVSAQTNLLAMNAAIEAAHAGDAGRGFAVVAQEVRHLAEASSKSANIIKTHVREMLQKVENGVEVAVLAEQSLAKITEGIQQTTQMMKEIAMVMDEQNTGSKMILTSISPLVEAAKSSARLMGDQEDSSKNMKRSMVELQAINDQVHALALQEASQSGQIRETLEHVNHVLAKNSRSLESLRSIFAGFKLDE